MARVVEVISEDRLIEQVRGVTLFKDPSVKPYENAKIDIRSIDLSEVRPTTLYVLRQNLEIQRRLAASLGDQGHDPLSLEGALMLDDGINQMGLTPPLVEVDQEHGPCLIDGAHRVYIGRETGRRVIRALYIDGTNPDHPIYAYPNDWEHILEYDNVPGDPALKKHYRNDNPVALYRDFSQINGSVMRQA